MLLSWYSFNLIWLRLPKLVIIGNHDTRQRKYGLIWLYNTWSLVYEMLGIWSKQHKFAGMMLGICSKQQNFAGMMLGICSKQQNFSGMMHGMF